MEVTFRIERALRGVAEAAPWAQVVQRHFRGRSTATAVKDASCEFNPRTAFRVARVSGSGNVVKYQPEWLDAAFAVLQKRKSNVLFTIGAEFRYGCPALADRKALDLFASTWMACKPLLDVILGRSA